VKVLQDRQCAYGFIFYIIEVLKSELLCVLLDSYEKARKIEIRLDSSLLHNAIILLGSSIIKEYPEAIVFT
jgi:hypothetical protein